MKVYSSSFLRRQEPLSTKFRFLPPQERRVGTNTPVTDLVRGSLEVIAKGRNPGIAQGSYNICPGVLQLPGRARMPNTWIIDSIRVED